MHGRTEPRIFTRPLVTGPPGGCGCGCALTPETSWGFDAVEFAERVAGHPFDPWQRWLVIHAGEIAADSRSAEFPHGIPRFRHVLVIVGRQNGKSEVPIMLGLYWLFVEDVPTILWTSTQLKYADKALTKVEQIARASDKLRPFLPEKKWKKTRYGSAVLYLGDQEFATATANDEGGRSTTVHRLVQDELRQHRTYDAWSAAVPAMSAVDDAQGWYLSNAGVDYSIVLADQRKAAIAAIRAGDTSYRTAIFEWSARDNADPEDVEALLQANPGVGFHGPSLDELVGEGKAAKAAGGKALAVFKTEKMCITVKTENPAVSMEAWADAGPAEDRPAVQLTRFRGKLALGVEVAPDSLAAAVYVAGVDDEGIVHVEPVAAWSGEDATSRLRAELPRLVAKVRPKAVGWIPGGPAAAVGADLAERKGPSRWPPPGVKVKAITSEVAQVCMGFSEQVQAGRLRHSGDPLLTAQAAQAEPAKRGDAWVFARTGGGWVHALYAAAVAVHVARTLPQPRTVNTVLSVPRAS